MTRFSANLGFLWKELELPDAIRAAKHAGFDAVECHWPYEFSARDIAKVLSETKMRMLGLNTEPGVLESGEIGLSALPGREAEARRAIDKAIAYASDIGAKNVHVMAGVSEGDAARTAFIANLRHACIEGAKHQLTILIEPLNIYDTPGYFLQTTTQAMALIEDVGATNLKLMFDCYHVYLMEGNLISRLEDLLPLIGHIQFADAPGRGAPGTGEIAFDQIFDRIRDLGYSSPLGAEYKPNGSTEDTLGWMKN